ncbi:YgfZ/GcvT domain-containing protein [Arthrobacter sp.]|uniref:CAF17-like 4Fe-4S cluster assembly/insertion protein YgfZ n=1 Tax=Arthrobacter sp. TaxID=1667 RepID=UPI003A923B93
MTWRSPLLDRPGAVEGTGSDAGVALHYGEPLPEQRRLDRGEAVADLSHRGVVTVTGPDRLSWLNNLSSQLLLGLEPGQGTEALFLTLQGRVEYDCRVVDDGDSTWLLVEGAEAAPLAAWLDSMRFMLRVEIHDVTDDWAVIGAGAPIASLAPRLSWRDPWPGVSRGGYAYSAPGHPATGRVWIEYLVPRAELETAVGDLRLAGTMAVEALRIAAWRPRVSTDADEKSIPHELDLLRTAVHLEKGCYKGQETIARVHNLGHPPRRIVFLHLDGSVHTHPAVGSEVRLGEKVVGKVTSVALHYEAGPIALATIRRNTDPTATLTVRDGDEDYPANQETIVATDAGQVVGRATGFLRPPR